MPLRDVAASRPRRRPGPKYTVNHWLDTLTDEMRAEVLELLNDVTIDEYRTHKTLVEEVGYPFGMSTIGNWRRNHVPA